MDRATGEKEFLPSLITRRQTSTSGETLAVETIATTNSPRAVVLLRLDCPPMKGGRQQIGRDNKLDYVVAALRAAPPVIAAVPLTALNQIGQIR